MTDTISRLVDTVQGNPYDAVQKFLQASKRALTSATQPTLSESIMADLVDDFIGYIPLIGDFVAETPRIIDAGAESNLLSLITHGIDFLVGLIPFYGDIIDTLIPANTINKVANSIECINNGGDRLECISPTGTFERDYVLNSILTI
jgi:hypothetical protein